MNVNTYFNIRDHWTLYVRDHWIPECFAPVHVRLAVVGLMAVHLGRHVAVRPRLPRVVVHLRLTHYCSQSWRQSLHMIEHHEPPHAASSSAHTLSKIWMWHFNGSIAAELEGAPESAVACHDWNKLYT